MRIAALMGPTPKSSVRVVPEAATAPVTRRRDARNWSSMRVRSSTSSSAWRWRSTAATPLGWRPASSSAAWATTISVLMPRATSSATWACRRQHTLLRQRPRSMWRLANSRSTVTWSSHRTSVIAGERSAATATERASLGSFLFERPLESTRTREAKVAGTSSTRSPAREQLLGQQIAQSVGGLDGPDARVIGRGPLEQLLALAPSRSDPQGGELEFVVVECHRGVGTLVGVDPDHHHLRQVLLIVG